MRTVFGEGCAVQGVALPRCRVVALSSEGKWDVRAAPASAARVIAAHYKAAAAGSAEWQAPECAVPGARQWLTCAAETNGVRDRPLNHSGTSSTQYQGRRT